MQALKRDGTEVAEPLVVADDGPVLDEAEVLARLEAQHRAEAPGSTPAGIPEALDPAAGILWAGLAGLALWTLIFAATLLIR